MVRAKRELNLQFAVSLVLRWKGITTWRAYIFAIFKKIACFTNEKALACSLRYPKDHSEFESFATEKKLAIGQCHTKEYAPGFVAYLTSQSEEREKSLAEKALKLAHYVPL